MSLFSFGSPAPATTTFGAPAPASNPFSSNPFGGTATPSFGGFGAQPAAAPAAAPQAFGGFGAATTPAPAGSAFGGFGGTVTGNQLQNTNNDLVVPNPPSDTISTIAFNPSNAYFAAGGWSKELCLYQYTQTGVAPTAKQGSKAPILCSSFHNDGQKLFFGGCDNSLQMWNVPSNQVMQVGAHSSPIKECFWIPEIQLVATGSWDKSIKYWDCRQQNPALVVNLPERVHAMDVKHPFLVCTTAEKKFYIYDIGRAPGQPYRVDASPLKYQIRCMSIFQDKTGFAAGSVEGRVAISHFAEKEMNKNFAFKCHREKENVYSVNCLAFHNFGTFATCGSDGIFVFWDKDAKQRLKQFNAVNNAITAATFNPQGNIFAYAIGYDYSKGYEYYEKCKQPCGILLHGVQEVEVQKKKPGAK